MIAFIATRKVSVVDRRDVLKTALAVPFLAGMVPAFSGDATVAAAAGRRVRPGDPSWPSAQAWQELNRAVEGRLSAVTSPLAICAQTPASTACMEVFGRLKNPYHLGDTRSEEHTSELQSPA